MEIRDVHNSLKYYTEARDNQIKEIPIKKNGEFILKYLRDAEIGKTIKKGRFKKLGAKRLYTSFSELRQLSKYFNKPFNKVTQKDFDEYIRALDNNEIKSQPRVFKQVRDFKHKKGVKIVARVKGGKDLSGETICTKKAIACKFIKHIGFKIDTSFVDFTFDKVKLPALTKEEFDKLVDNCSDFPLSVYLQVCYDLGDRFSEFANYRIASDIKEVESKKGNDKFFVFDITLPNKNRKNHKRKNATLIPKTAQLIRTYLATLPKDQEYFCTYSYESIKQKIKRLTKKVLGRNDLTWHLVTRHSSATHWCVLLDRANFCKRFSWAYNSSAPDRYIDASKIGEIKLAEQHLSSGYEKVTSENEGLKIKHEQFERDLEGMKDTLRKTKKVIETIFGTPEGIEALKQMGVTIKN